MFIQFMQLDYDAQCKCKNCGNVEVIYFKFTFGDPHPQRGYKIQNVACSECKQKKLTVIDCPEDQCK